MMQLHIISKACLTLKETTNYLHATGIYRCSSQNRVIKFPATFEIVLVPEVLFEHFSSSAKYNRTASTSTTPKRKKEINFSRLIRNKPNYQSTTVKRARDTLYCTGTIGRTISKTPNTVRTKEKFCNYKNIKEIKHKFFFTDKSIAQIPI
jgi:hypothetical protein